MFLQVFIQVLASVVSLRSVTDVQVSAVFLADLSESFHACMVVVKKAVDAFVAAQRIESLVYIRYGVQYNVVLPVQFRIIRSALLSQCQKGEVVHKSLEYITGPQLFAREQIFSIYSRSRPGWAAPVLL